MTSNHTPGPWRVFCGGIADEGVREVILPNGDCAARLGRNGNGLALSANACLMAASPDLLAALARISLMEADSTSSAAEKIRSAARIARAAIAKAEGRA